MIKLKNILSEADGIQRFKFVRQTPGSPELVKLAQEQDPPGAAFIIKSTIELGEYTDQQILDKVIQNLKNDEMFGETSRWADGRFLYLFGPDLKDAQRKTRFNVMVLPTNYILDSIAGDIGAVDLSGTDIESSTGLEIWEPEKLRAVIEANLQAKYYIGSAPVYFQQDIDALTPKIIPFMTAVVAKKYQDLAMKQSAELESLKQSAVKDQQVLDDESTDKTAETDKTTDDTATKIKPDDVMARLKEAPIKLNTTSDDVKYIQDLMYRIGMATPELGEKNDVPEWVAFRDAKPQYGTYGTRTQKFLNALGFTAAKVATGNITSDTFQKILDAGKPIGITESEIKLKNLINEQFVIKRNEVPADTKTTDTKKTTASVTKKITTTDTKKNQATKTSTATGTFHPIGTAWNKLDYTTPIKQGDKGQEVKAMQIFINGINAAGGETDGIAFTKEDGVYGPDTHESAKMAAFRIPYDPSDYITIKTPASLSDWSKHFSAWKSYSEKEKLSTATATEISEHNKMQKIWQDVYDVVTGNPKKYFYTFTSWYNDNEEEAANWFIKAFNDAWGSTLKQLKSSKSFYTRKNVETIEYVVNYIANKLIRKGYSGRVKTTYYFVSGKEKKWKTQKLTFEWNYF